MPKKSNELESSSTEATVSFTFDSGGGGLILIRTLMFSDSSICEMKKLPPILGKVQRCRFKGLRFTPGRARLKMNTSQPTEQQQPLEGRCNFFVARKVRFCRMQAVKGKKYCSEHLFGSLENCDRIACPLDPSHSVTRSGLDKHLKICNFAKKQSQIKYFSTDANTNVASLEKENYFAASKKSKGDSDILCKSSEEAVDLIHTSNNSTESSSHLIHASNENSTDSNQPLATSETNQNASQFNSQAICELEIQQLYELLTQETKIIPFTENISNFSPSHKQKHKFQIQSLFKLFIQPETISSDTGLIELCAGKAETSFFFAQNLPNSQAKFALLDCKNYSRKKDLYIKKLGFECIRLEIDIRNFDSAAYVKENSLKECLFYAKHACGKATDFSLFTILNAVRNGSFSGLIIALCCHHQCEWQHFFAKSQLQQLVPDAEKTFASLKYISSWATCNFPTGKERENLGFKAKRVLDLLRVQSLKSVLPSNFQVSLLEYCPVEITLENTALLIRKKGIDSPNLSFGTR